MLVNKTVEFFLSEVARRGWRSAVSGSGQGPDEMPAGRNRVAAGRDGSGQMRGVPRLGWQRPGTGRGAGGKITGAGGGLGARCLRVPGLGWTRCRRPNHRGRRRAWSETPGGAEAWLAVEPLGTG